ncbi:Fibrinogen alpha chain [Triplophysa tibetana]|uniref:Fibrinogen alpha chain n=1 Tax=Triplophysa tibetana TaxID=1572043 RepID=A0A5A9PLP0_9TELE|nr:Fibrinogen alpha chain [Triplophysa tibetana]
MKDTDTVVNPRGARPVEHGYKAQDTCQTKEWPMCTDDDWESKCPSGCRVQGLIDKADHDLVKKIEKIRRLLDEGKQLYRSADQDSKTTYSYLRERLTLDAGNDNRYATLAEKLRQRIFDLKIKIDNQLRLLHDLKTRVKEQAVAMQRLEVDIDIKLRACKGSCSSYDTFTVDKESYVQLDKQMSNLNALHIQSVETVSSLSVMKSRPLKDVVLPNIYKSAADPTKTEQKLLFGDVGQIQLSLEAEGSTAESAATVSKIPTGMDSSTHKVHCSKSVRKTVMHTKDGLVEKLEVTGGGPGCEDLGKLGVSDQDFLAAANEGKDLSRDGVKITVTRGDERSITTLNHGTDDLGGFGEDFFKDLGTDTRKLSTSSSTSTSKSLAAGSNKAISSSKTVLSSDIDFGDDLGAFLRSDVEEDHPDIHARSLKTRDERKTAVVGEDCVDIQQKHAHGSQSGLFKIKPPGSEEIVVYCDQGTGLAGFGKIDQQAEGFAMSVSDQWSSMITGYPTIDKIGDGEKILFNMNQNLILTDDDLLDLAVELAILGEFCLEFSSNVGVQISSSELFVVHFVSSKGDLLKMTHRETWKMQHERLWFGIFGKKVYVLEDKSRGLYGCGYFMNSVSVADYNDIFDKVMSKSQKNHKQFSTDISSFNSIYRVHILPLSTS